VSSGIFAVLWAVSGTRRYITLMVVTFVMQMTFNAWLAHFLSRRHAGMTPFNIDSRLQHILVTDAALTLSLIVLGYTLFIAFAGGEGTRAYRAFTELKLANEIHRTLVPPIERTFPGFELAALSIPSGAMGGDLVDVADTKHSWLAYLADVSGHGVGAGITMSMVKSAVHTYATDSGDPQCLLPALNRVLATLTPGSTLVTFASISGNAGPDLTIALAGHLPVLHYRRRAGAVEEKWVSNFPLAVFPDSQFESIHFSCEAGDLIAVVSDGLTETTNSNGDELGLEPLKMELARNADKPLMEVITAMRYRALEFGKQLDDQSVLLIRRQS
jgi:serine phosphatase RsbU (regulator of sigma subunit)